MNARRSWLHPVVLLLTISFCLLLLSVLHRKRLSEEVMVIAVEEKENKHKVSRFDQTSVNVSITQELGEEYNVIFANIDFKDYFDGSSDFLHALPNEALERCFNVISTNGMTVKNLVLIPKMIPNSLYMLRKLLKTSQDNDMVFLPQNIQASRFFSPKVINNWILFFETIQQLRSNKDAAIYLILDNESLDPKLNQLCPEDPVAFLTLVFDDLESSFAGCQIPSSLSNRLLMFSKTLASKSTMLSFSLSETYKRVMVDWVSGESGGELNQKFEQEPFIDQNTWILNDEMEQFPRLLGLSAGTNPQLTYSIGISSWNNCILGKKSVCDLVLRIDSLADTYGDKDLELAKEDVMLIKLRLTDSSSHVSL